MTLEAIQKRIDGLRQHRDSLDAARRQIEQDIAGTDGAIMDCEFWAKQIGEESCKSNATEPPPPTV